MKPKAIVRIGIDIGMTVLLLLLMAYELIGSGLHEWIGLAMFVLFVCHHLLNRGWYKNLFRGSYTPMRLLQTILAGLVLLTMLGAMVSSVLISREVFAFLPISGGRSLGRTLHLLCAYWGFVLLSLHLGIHWRSMMAMAGRLWTPSPSRRTAAHGAASPGGAALPGKRPRWRRAFGAALQQAVCLSHRTHRQLPARSLRARGPRTFPILRRSESALRKSRAGRGIYGASRRPAKGGAPKRTSQGKGTDSGQGEGEGKLGDAVLTGDGDVLF